MKTVALFFLLFLFIFNAQAQLKSGLKLDVQWVIDIRNDDSLNMIPFVLFNELKKGKLKAYDSCEAELDTNQIKERITPSMRTPVLSLEECFIMIANGVFDIVDKVITNYTAKELQEHISKDEKLEALIQLKYYHPFETNDLQLEIFEQVVLDTSVHRQLGEIQFIRLVIPKEYSTSHKNEILCQFNYEDIKKLKLPNFGKIEQHTFQVYTTNSDLIVYDGKQFHRLSSLRNPRTSVTSKAEARKLIFNYFTRNIIFIQTTDKDEIIDDLD